MHVVVRVRIFLTRHRWVHWVVVALLSSGVGWTVHQQIESIGRARASWGATRSVLVATADMDPDGPISVARADVPAAVVPRDAIGELPAGARIHQRVTEGEMLTAADLTAGSGPSAHAPPGTVVVGVADPLARDGSVGLVVHVASEGVVLAERGTVVAISDDVIFVAVDERAAPAVAAAAQAGLASLLFVP